MMRMFTILLLLIIVFLTGMIIGIDREQQSMGILDGSMIEFEEVKEDEIVLTEHLEEDTDSPLHVTQKTAIFLEKGVKGFYEVVVEVLYQFSTLFF